MVRLGMFTDPHGLDLAGSIKKVFGQEGLPESSRVCLGDGIFHTLTTYTSHLARVATLQRMQLLKNTSFRKRVIEGDYSDEQLQKAIVDPFQQGEEIADAVARALYQDWKQAFPEAVWLGGNHDRRVAKDILGDKLLEERLVDFDGLPVLGLTGGGDSPKQNSFFARGLYADDPERETYHHKKWVQPVIQNVASGQINTIFSHIPPKVKDDADHLDIAERHLQDIIEAAWEKRKTNPSLSDEQKEQPVTVFWGHKHVPTTVEFIEYESGTEILSVTPGMSGHNHNYGPQASFVISEFDDAAKRLARVQEYRVYTFIDRREVEHHGTHTINWDERKVDFAKAGKVVATEDLTAIDTHLSLDTNYFLTQECFSRSYDGLSTAAKHDLLVKKLAAADDFAAETVMKARDVLNEVRRSLAYGKEAKDEISFDEITTARLKAHQGLAEAAASYLGVDVSGLPGDPSADLYRNIVIHAVFGLEGAAIYRSLLDPDLTAGKAGDWGESLLGDLQKSTRGTYQMHGIQGLEAHDFQEMAEAYKPLNVQRIRDFLPFEKQEAINFWVKAWNKGLLSEDDLTETGHYKKKEEGTYTANPKTKEQLMDMLGVESLSEEAPDEAAQQRTQQMQQIQEIQALDQLMKKYGIGFTDEHGQQVPGLPLRQMLNPERNPVGSDYGPNSSERLPSLRTPERPDDYKVSSPGISLGSK